MYDINKIYEAYTLEEALKLKNEHKNAIVIGGGSDVLVELRGGKYRGCDLLSIYLIDELRGVSLDDNENIRIGALTSFSDVCEDKIINERLKLLKEACQTVAGPQIRNIGTLGGNVCNGVTSADSATSLLALDAKVELKSIDKVRILPLKDFYLKAKKVDLKENEILSAIIIDKENYKDYKGFYYKYALRDAMDIATCTACVNLKVKDNKIEDAKIAYGVAAPIPIRVFNAEKLLCGKELKNLNIDNFYEKALEEINPRDSWRASRDFRIHILKQITNRCIKEIQKKFEI